MRQYFAEKFSTPGEPRASLLNVGFADVVSEVFDVVQMFKNGRWATADIKDFHARLWLDEVFDKLVTLVSAHDPLKPGIQGGMRKDCTNTRCNLTHDN